MRTNHTKRAELDRENDELTIAVTLSWRRPWALDGCEAAVIVGEVQRALAERFGPAEWDQLAGIVEVATYDPDEENNIVARGGAFERAS